MGKFSAVTFADPRLDDKICFRLKPDNLHRNGAARSGKGREKYLGRYLFHAFNMGNKRHLFPFHVKIARCPVQYHRFRIYFPFCRIRYDDNVRAKTIFQCFQTVLKAHDCHGTGKNDKGQEKGKHEESRRPQRPAGQIPPGQPVKIHGWPLSSRYGAGKRNHPALPRSSIPP